MSERRGPIFIGGLAYSGKTQLRMVLGAHPELSMTRRTHLWDRFYGRFGNLSRDRNLDRCLTAIANDPDVRRLEPDVGSIRRAFRSGPSTYPRLFGLFHEQHAGREGARRWGDQLGFVERFADPILTAFPTARMIHMVRDPRSRLAAGSGGRPVGRGTLGWETARWLDSAALAERNQRRYPDRYRIVRYETLASSPGDTVAGICAFLGERVTASMAQALARVELTDAPASPRSPAEAALLHRYARRELHRLGYPDADAPSSLRDRLAFWFVEWPVDRAAMALECVGARRSPLARQGV